MKKFLLSVVAVAALAAPALADPAVVKHDFRRDGIRYVATETIDSGVRTIVGEAVEGSSSNFTLRVKNGWVSGYVDGARVSYPEPVAARKVLASR